MRALRLLPCLIAITACHDLPALGICGNGIVEANLGEACDDGDPTALCTATCELACATAETAPADYAAVSDALDAPRCPVATSGQAYTCAPDRTCRLPSSQFQVPTTPVELAIDQPPVAGDVDGDGIVDLVGTSTAEVVTRTGGRGEALFQGVLRQTIPASASPPRLFVQDATADAPPIVTLAVAGEGIAYLRSAAGRFVPELALAFELQSLERARTFIATDPDAVLGLGDVVMAMAPEGVDGIQLGRALIPLPDRLGDLVPSRAAPRCGRAGVVYRPVGVEVDADQRSFTVVATIEGGGWAVCQYAHRGGWWEPTLVEVPAASWDLRGFAWANLDADPCRELALGTTDGLRYLESDAACQLGPAVILLTPGEDGTLLAAAPLVPGGHDELVLSTGVVEVYEAAGGQRDTRSLIVPPSGTWTQAVIVDLSGDGVSDVVASRLGVGSTPVSDLDVVRSGPVLNQYRVDTRAAVSNLIPGDFDGDRIGDIALIEGTPGAAFSRLSILFGSRDTPATSPQYSTDPVQDLQALRLRRAPWARSSQTRDGTDDLVLARSAPAGLLAGFLIGDARRVPTTPRFLPIEGSSLAPRPLADFAIGRSLDGVQGVVTARAGDVISSVVDQPADENRWEVIGRVGEELLDPPYGAFRSSTAAFLTATVAAPTRTGALPKLVERTSPPRECSGPQLLGEIPRLGAVDANGDGDEELVVYRDLPDGPDGAEFQLDVFDVADCTADFSTPLVSLPGCTDLVRVAGTLVAICRAADGGGTEVVRLDPASYAPGPPLVTILGAPRYLSVGDFDGDGLDDLAVVVGRSTSVLVTVLRQCPAHDTRDCPISTSM